MVSCLSFCFPPFNQVFFSVFSANAAGSTFGSSGPSTGFAFGAPSAPAAGGFNFGAVQANAGSSTFAFAPSGGGTPAFGASGTPAATGEFVELVGGILLSLTVIAVLPHQYVIQRSREFV